MSTEPGCRSVPKLVGGDFELANFVLGVSRSEGTSDEASKMLLAEIEGVPAAGGVASWLRSDSRSWARAHSGWYANPQDQGRKFLETNGGCAYLDLQHCELCIPEVCSAFDHAAASMAMLRIAGRARVAAEARLPEGQSLQVLANNSDGRSNSYGSHLNFLVSREVWADIIERRPHYLQYLAAHQLSSMIYCGQGKVGSENGRPDVDYQISQRADFLETTVGPQTTYRRPIVNSRDESLCGEERGLARLHVIFFDQTLLPGSSVLKVGAMQIVLALLEAEVIDAGLGIDDPVAAAVTWSHDPSLEASVALLDGTRATALEVQEKILALARKHYAEHGLPTVARADEILALWADTLERLRARDFEALEGRIDWVLKRSLLERALAVDASLTWKSPQLAYLDQIYSSLDEREGLGLACLRDGLVEAWIGEDEIAHFEHEPPADTRAWTRAMLLRRFRVDEIEKIDWDHIRLVLGANGASRSFEFRMDDPFGFTREQTAHLFEDAAEDAR